MCETLLLEDPIDYGLKIVDLLWRKAAYDPIQIFKRERDDYEDRIASEIEILYRMHLSAMFTFYSNLLIKFGLMLKPHRNLSEFFDFIMFPSDQKRKRESFFFWPNLFFQIDFSSAVLNCKMENFVESLMKHLHKCLVALGDLSRYLSEYDGSTQTAEKYYTMALLLDPEIGKF